MLRGHANGKLAFIPTLQVSTDSLGSSTPRSTTLFCENPYTKYCRATRNMGNEI